MQKRKKAIIITAAAAALLWILVSILARAGCFIRKETVEFEFVAVVPQGVPEEDSCYVVNDGSWLMQAVKIISNSEGFEREQEYYGYVFPEEVDFTQNDIVIVFGREIKEFACAPMRTVDGVLVPKRYDAYMTLSQEFYDYQIFIYRIKKVDGIINTQPVTNAKIVTENGDLL